MFPRARTDRLTVRELPDETLVYDHDRHKGHCLNATAALVWRHCDGKTSVDELARIVARELRIAQAAAVVGLALEQLHRRLLLDETPLPGADRVSRREALKRLALAAVTLPLVMTVATKTAAQSLSQADPPPATSPPVNLNVSLPVTVNTSPPSPPAKQATTSPPPPPVPCRMSGQSCLAAVSNTQGTCCAGLRCAGVSQGAGVCV